jgi:iron complex outermembrane receptor protein
LDREPYRGDFNRVGKTTLDIWGGHLRGDFSLGRIDVTTLTGFEIYERFRDADRDFTPDSVFEAISNDAAKQFTQDFNFSGRLFDSAVRWNLGGSYLGERIKGAQTSFVVSNGAPSDFPLTGLLVYEVDVGFDQNTAAFMTYGDVTWDFLEDFTFELGARFNSEKKDFNIFRFNSSQPALGVTSRADSGRWNKPTGQISLSYHLTDSVTFHAKFTHGYKAGHFNTNSIVDNIQAEPEFIDAFEWSANVNALEGRVIGRFGFFYYKYRDYQVFIFIDRPDNSIPNLVIVNANRVQQYGAEVDLTLKPLRDWVPEPYDQLTLDMHFGWLASQFLDFTNIDFRNAGETQGLIPIVTEYSGNRLINSPDFKVNGTVSWAFDFDEWGKITPRYDVTWVADTYFDAAEGRGTPGINFRSKQETIRLPPYTLAQRAYWIHNVRLSYQTPLANVEVSAWVRNIKDTRYKTYAFDVSLFAKSVINFVGDPRSVGADIQITW